MKKTPKNVLLLIGVLVMGMPGPVWASALATRDTDVVGAEIRISPGDLPAPYETPSVANSVRKYKGGAHGTLDLPPGFRVNAFRDDLDHARWLEVLENGDVLLAEPRRGAIRLLRDADGDGQAEIKETFLANLDRPHGMAVVGDWLYIGEATQVRRVPLKLGDMVPAGPVETVTPKGSLGDGRGHWTRNLAFNRAENALYISVGSRGNVAEEPLPRASIQRLGLASGNMTTFAEGLRNPVGIAFYPGTGDLYTVVNERDGFGDELVPDFLTHVRQGAFYGWPYAYIGANPDPDYGDRSPDKVARTVIPDVLFRSHSAPLGLAFGPESGFPEAYRKDAYVALHGSWNAADPRGYKIVRVPFEDGRPSGAYINFAVGFRVGEGSPPKAWGRPAGLAFGRDGALLVADDVSQTIWRISYDPSAL
ncbi:PQQ-dependent sugar dehydrogenase [Sneathiella chinensis]|uniref:Sorbosone dehydrogenase n=1 Tax=Sneathiella chinensis TaxID=349750 RepID=A0ABQ5U9I7_9PROT|nr:PQQ-dependent sugar dehydrogenase [Sneathiella chinensis]GLQ07914.1 sorbosone dehydrogenase [Sneathiella chinensis]